MKIAIRGGHNIQASGAVGIVSEVTEDRKIYASVIKYLKLNKNEVLDVTPSNCVSAEDLASGVNQANAFKADLFCSIHLNAGGGKGTEVLYALGSATGKELATRVCNSISKLGFVSRGAKVDSRGLYELRRTVMPAVIVECFFCDSQVDVDLYNKLGADAIGKAIAEGIVGHEIKEIKPTLSTTLKNNICLDFQKFYNHKVNPNIPILEDGVYGKETFTAMNTLESLMKEGK